MVKIITDKVNTKILSGNSFRICVPDDFPGTHYLASSQILDIDLGITVQSEKRFLLFFKSLIRGLYVPSVCAYSGRELAETLRIPIVNIHDELIEIKPGILLVEIYIFDTINLGEQNFELAIFDKNYVTNNKQCQEVKLPIPYTGDCS